ncbi:unnamed protein product [Caenorhabditis auriculariae]|uniref:Uncharacterized protein n=1 Tax=Caenorhabditis auriculariae TaxID=2777116 RepID=A0A8S1HBR8_9PELO|nr:unnamed protein product [Caenorhabditis auriculariae]
MLLYVPLLGLLSTLGLLVAYSLPERRGGFYIRIPRAEDPEHTFNPLGPAQFYDYEMYPHEATAHERESFKFMETPMALSNPVWNMVSKVSDFYRWMRRVR